jgi:hypothetical protein
VDGVRLFRTDAFTRDGACFNKGAAIEEGFDALGRWGWILLLDADIVLPSTLEPGPLCPDVIYTMRRRQLDGEAAGIDGDWGRWEVMPSVENCFGYFQLFHAYSESLRSRPWYPTGIRHAGFSDDGFVAKFPERVVLEGSVLHIGHPFENWCGRIAPRLDGGPVPGVERNRLRMGELLLDHGWTWARPDLLELALAARQPIR